MHNQTKQYFILIGRPTEDRTHYEMVFGDYDKAVVMQEKKDTSLCDYRQLRVVPCQDSQVGIQVAVNLANAA